jgi:hypothetical protein
LQLLKVREEFSDLEHTSIHNNVKMKIKNMFVPVPGTKPKIKLEALWAFKIGGTGLYASCFNNVSYRS